MCFILNLLFYLYTQHPFVRYVRHFFFSVVLSLFPLFRAYSVFSMYAYSAWFLLSGVTLSAFFFVPVFLLLSLSTLMRLDQIKSDVP